MSGIKAVLFDAKKQQNGKKVVNLTHEEKKKDKKSIKEEPKEKAKSPGASETRQKLEEFIESSSEVLFNVKAVYPFDLFPDEVRVDRNQIHILVREFFWSMRIHSIRIENIIEIFLDMGPFFATLNITEESFGKNVVNVKYLPKERAKKLRRIIQGLMVVKKQKVSLEPLGKVEVIEKLEQIGSSKE